MAFQHISALTRAQYGYSSVKDAMTPGGWYQSDDQESFWLAETLKYLYLIFDDPSRVSLDEWVFNTEAHPLRRGRKVNWWRSVGWCRDVGSEHCSRCMASLLLPDKLMRRMAIVEYVYRVDISSEDIWNLVLWWLQSRIIVIWSTLPCYSFSPIKVRQFTWSHL